MKIILSLLLLISITAFLILSRTNDLNVVNTNYASSPSPERKTANTSRQLENDFENKASRIAITTNKDKEEYSWTRTDKESRKEYSDESIVNEVSQKIKERASEIDVEHVEKITKINEAMRNAEWEKFLELHADLTTISPELLKLAILQAINANAPLHVIEELVNMGGEIPDQAIVSLALKGNIELIKGLTPLGLDLFYVDSYGRDAYTFAAMSGKNVNDIYMHLRDENVSISHPHNNNDALYLLLENPIIQSKENPVEILISLGIKIENKHKEILDSMKTKDPETYNRIVLLNPELIIERSK